ncbi:MAG TPA: IS1595 family transposase [Bosea sp. (in: a-proteobacteria)]
MPGSTIFRSETAAYLFVERLAWDGRPRCPHCGERTRLGRLQGSSTPIGTWKCYRCRKPFSVRIGTAFHHSHVPLHVWLQALYLLADKEGATSVLALVQTLAVSQRTAWHLKQKIVAALSEVTDEPLPPDSGLDGEDTRAEDGEQAHASWANASRHERFLAVVGPVRAPETWHRFLLGLFGLLGRRSPAGDVGNADRDADRDEEFQLELALDPYEVGATSHRPSAWMDEAVNDALQQAAASHADPTKPGDSGGVDLHQPRRIPQRQMAARSPGPRFAHD